eukprot:TRINITY_DN4662_c0_g5_i2.p1 TRINITY_DN4662_c0_g5~~TRINITY_DN4662_c0_g5_i2.p1  ORF type:complete len:137 (-),score=18.08 TRINITY_DN4662_c0_g5_i2:61-471(-)
MKEDQTIELDEEIERAINNFLNQSDKSKVVSKPSSNDKTVVLHKISPSDRGFRCSRVSGPFQYLLSKTTCDRDFLDHPLTYDPFNTGGFLETVEDLQKIPEKLMNDRQNMLYSVKSGCKLSAEQINATQDLSLIHI